MLIDPYGLWPNWGKLIKGVAAVVSGIAMVAASIPAAVVAGPLP